MTVLESKTKNYLSLFDKHRASERIEESSSSPPWDDKVKLRLEIDKYLGEPVQSSTDPIQYWSNALQNGSSPTLGQMAKKYLCTPATSVESERLFSTAALTLTDLRKSMTVENLQQLLFLKCNVPLEGFKAVP
ncbi:hypothetical protein L596_025432 [Steinernema carpocapsae]|uniref:HAT C-terminal dimerisation domain-containing protein n=1 Tax=Steinernema carpocapsae TaxID=34508 RepID=A0A4U5M7S4_STECR|nr:hypothetical protein L596_025432 [Steinernema carpocapsae]